MRISESSAAAAAGAQLKQLELGGTGQGNFCAKFRPWPAPLGTHKASNPYANVDQDPSIARHALQSAPPLTIQATMFRALVGVARRSQALEGLGPRLEQGAAAWAAGPSSSGADAPQQRRSHATHSHYWQQAKSSSGDHQRWDLLHDQVRQPHHSRLRRGRLRRAGAAPRPCLPPRPPRPRPPRCRATTSTPATACCTPR